MKLLYKALLATGGAIAVFGSSLAAVTHGATNSSSDSYTPSAYSYIKPFKIKSSDGLRDLDLNIDSFRNAIKSFGATKSNPMQLDYITPYSTLGPLNTAMYNQIASEISNTLSDGLIKFSWLLATNSNPSSSTWFASGNSEMGFYLWSPDYDGVGTWISAWIQMDENGNNISNAINAWKLIHERMVNVLNNKDEYVNIYGENYYNAAKSLLEKLVEYKLYNETYSVNDPSKIPMDYKQAFKDVGQSNSQTLNMDFFISQILSGETGLNITNFIIQVLDSNFMFMPMPGAGLNYKDATLYDPQFIPRDSPFAGTSLRDYGVRDASTYTPINGSQHGVFKSIVSADFFGSSQQLFNQSFGNATPFLNQNDVGQISLVDMETTGGWSNEDPDSRPIDHLRLNGAKEVKLYDSSDNLLQTISRNQDIDMNDETTATNLQKAVKYEFTIDTSMAWVDNNGTSKQALSGKDFERGFEAFWLASEIGLQKNGYFINSVNLDIDKTVNYDSTTKISNNTTINSDAYDINNFTNTDDTFTVHLKEPSTYLLQYLSKGYFWALPNTNEEVKGIKFGQNGIENNPTNISWQNIYGDGTKASDIMDGNFWSAAPYYLEKITSEGAQEISYKQNSYYFNARKDDLLNKDEKIQQYIMRSVPAINAANLFENFNAGNVSSALIPADQSTTVLQDPARQNQILYVGVAKSSQSNYAIFNGNPYEADGKTLKSTINPIAANFLSDPQSDEALIIRAGLSGFVNWYNISQIVYTAGDFDYSVVPYGVFTWDGTNEEGQSTQLELYRQIFDGTYKPFSIDDNGALPRAVLEYIEAGLGV